MCDKYSPSDSLNTISDTSLPLSEPDSSESSCSLVFRDGEWQMPLDEDDMSYQSFNPKRASSPLPASGNISIHISIIQYSEIIPSCQNSFK